MNFIDKYTRLFRKISISGLIRYIIVTMVLFFACDLLLSGQGFSSSSMFGFNRTLILSGEVWRVFTFLFLPSSSSPIWFIFSAFFYYFIGTALEEYWGSEKFTAYVITGAVLTIISGFITGYAYNLFLFLSFFLVYATLNPNTEFRIYFVLPIKAKWLAYVYLLIILYSFIFGGMTIRLLILASFINYALFFGGDFINRKKNQITHKDFYKQIKKGK